MFDDLFSFAGDFFSGVGDVVGDVVGTVADAFSAVPSTIESLTSGMGNLLGGSSDLASSSPVATMLTDEGVGSAMAEGGFAAPAAAAAKEASSFAPDPMQIALGAENSFDSGAMDQVLSRAADVQSGGGKGLINSVTGWMKENPTAAAMALGGIKSAFSPDPIRVAREKQQAELEAKIQLAQWLKDNNRAGGVGVNLNLRPGGGAPVQRLTGEQVYGPQGLVAQGGLIRPYMRG